MVAEYSGKQSMSLNYQGEKASPRGKGMTKHKQELPRITKNYQELPRGKGITKGKGTTRRVQKLPRCTKWEEEYIK